MSTITITEFQTSRLRPVRAARPVPIARQAAATPAVRLTRRGKAAVLVLAVAAIAVLAVMFGPSSTATSEIGATQETTTVRVLPGHTLWQIAAEANPSGDIRDTVDEIVELNALPNASALQMGSEIAVPVYDK